MQLGDSFAPIQVTEDELVGALDLLDVPFLIGGVQDDTAHTLAPAALMAGLAQARSARVRSALIPLFLRHPEFSDQASIAVANLTGVARNTLQLSYTAAFLLQKEYSERITCLFGGQPQLLDLFSRVLDVELGDDLNESLARLGKRNAELSGLDINWVGGYKHAALTWLEYVEWRAERRNRKAWRTA